MFAPFPFPFFFFFYYTKITQENMKLLFNLLSEKAVQT